MKINFLKSRILTIFADCGVPPRLRAKDKN